MFTTAKLEQLTESAKKHSPDSFAKTFGFIQGSLRGVARVEQGDKAAEAVDKLLEVAWQAYMSERAK